MNPKNIVKIILLSVVGAAFLFMGIKAWSDKNAKQSKIAKKMTVYYFHVTARCRTCKSIEKHTIDAINKSFPGFIKSGELKFVSINLDDAKHKHFIKDFKLKSRTVVLVKNTPGKKLSYLVLYDTWKYAHNEKKFFEYISSEAGKFFDIIPKPSDS